MVNIIFLYKLFIGVKKINGHAGVNFSFRERNLNYYPNLRGVVAFWKITAGVYPVPKMTSLPLRKRKFKLAFQQRKSEKLSLSRLETEISVNIYFNLILLFALVFVSVVLGGAVA